MLRIWLLATLLLFAHSSHADDITYSAADGVTVHATVQETDRAPSSAVVILFHQAGSNGRGEYASIAPRLTEEGYSLLIVDQRSGGDRFGASNRTVTDLGTSTDYCDAYPDMEASLNYANERFPDQPLIVVGSSYSAGLSVKLAADYGDQLAGVVAFSPAYGGRMQACNPNDYIEQAKSQIAAFRPASETHRPSQQFQLDRFSAAGHLVHIAEHGVHGASMLDEDRTEKSTRQEWSRFLDFLEMTAQRWENRDETPEENAE